MAKEWTQKLLEIAIIKHDYRIALSEVKLKSELEMAIRKVQSIAVDVVLSTRAKLMEEYKKGEHASWDLDQEIQTWKKTKGL